MDPVDTMIVCELAESGYEANTPLFHLVLVQPGGSEDPEGIVKEIHNLNGRAMLWKNSS